MMVSMRRDLTVVDGNHRMSAALSACSDIREFKMSVFIVDDDGTKKRGMLYFDKNLNRLNLSDGEEHLSELLSGQA